MAKQDVQTIKLEIINLMEFMTLEDLQLLYEFAVFLSTRTPKQVSNKHKGGLEGLRKGGTFPDNEKIELQHETWTGLSKNFNPETIERKSTVKNEWLSHEFGSDLLDNKIKGLVSPNILQSMRETIFDYAKNSVTTYFEIIDVKDEDGNISRKIRHSIVETFDVHELQMLVSDLGVNWDSLPGTTVDEKAHNLIGWHKRRGRLNELISLLREERGHIDWPYID